jgi:hypothetical protein
MHFGPEPRWLEVWLTPVDDICPGLVVLASVMAFIKRYLFRTPRLKRNLDAGIILGLIVTRIPHLLARGLGIFLILVSEDSQVSYRQNPATIRLLKEPKMWHESVGERHRQPDWLTPLASSERYFTSIRKTILRDYSFYN